MEEAITRRELLLRGIVVASGLVLSSLLAACAEIPETREVAEATVSATPEVMPTYTPTSTPEPSPTATKKPAATPTSEPTTPTPEEITPTPEPATPTPAEAIPTPEEPIEYVIVQQINACELPNEASCGGYIKPGKRFTILEEQGDWLYVRVVDEKGENPWNWWIQASETAYYPEGEVPPPTPTPETPPAYCTEPHYTGRTPDRKTGIVIDFGTPKQEIEPDRPYIMKYFRVDIGAPWYTRRDARITAIDQANQVITFQLSDGSTRQRRFTGNTLMVMMAHNVDRGMPRSEFKQLGGNFCDLEVGDVASILHPDEPESANPNPGLTDLWGVFIVQ